MLPQKLYEALRWLICVVLPAVAVFLSTLNAAWEWGLPIEAILSTISGFELFLGAIFGISKVVNDKNEG